MFHCQKNHRSTCCGSVCEIQDRILEEGRCGDTTLNLYPLLDENDKNSEQDNFGRLKDLVRVMARAIFKSLIVHGGAGAETMDIVAGTLTEEGLVQNKDWFVIEGKVTPFVLYQILFKHRKGDILVFDHVDSIWNHQVVVDMLKSALDSYDVCTVGWLSQRTLNVFRMNGEEKEAYNDKVDQEYVNRQMVG